MEETTSFPCAFELTQEKPRSGHRTHLTYVESTY